MKKRGPKPLITDEQILKVIEELQLVTASQLITIFKISNVSISNKLKKLLLKEKVYRFKMTIGAKRGSTKGGVVNLFDGFSYCTNSLHSSKYYYYVNENVALKIIIQKMQISPNLFRQHRKRLTSFLKNGLSSTLFQKVYFHYTSNSNNILSKNR